MEATAVAKTCEHCGLVIEEWVGSIWIHCATRLMACGAFYTTHARPRRDGGNQDGFCRDCRKPVWWHNLDGFAGGRSELVTRDGQKWCYGPDGSRGFSTHWHALPGMAQYVVPAAEGQVCHCLARAEAHIHQIVPAPVTRAAVPRV